MKVDQMAIIPDGVTNRSVMPGVFDGAAARAATGKTGGHHVKLRQQPNSDEMPTTSHHYGISDGYLPDASAVKFPEVSENPVFWCGQWMGYVLPSWNDAGKGDFKIYSFRWRYADSAVDGAWVLQDISRALRKNRLVSGAQRLRWLIQMTHLAFSRLVRNKAAATSLGLTERELEVMKWTADGKSAQDVADILLVSKHTVNFHIKNSVAKLEAPNKTAAVVRAALLGLLS